MACRKALACSRALVVALGRSTRLMASCCMHAPNVSRCAMHLLSSVLHLHLFLPNDCHANCGSRCMCVPLQVHYCSKMCEQLDRRQHATMCNTYRPGVALTSSLQSKASMCASGAGSGMVRQCLHRLRQKVCIQLLYSTPVALSTTPMCVHTQGSYGQVSLYGANLVTNWRVTSDRVQLTRSSVLQHRHQDFDQRAFARIGIEHLTRMLSHSAALEAAHESAAMDSSIDRWQGLDAGMQRQKKLGTVMRSIHW